MQGLDEAIEGARDTISVRRVFGEEYEKDGVTIIPVAAIRGGGGGGGGVAAKSGDEGGGGGFGMIGRPVGVYQIKDGETTWVPAADTTRVIVLSQLVAVIGLLVFRSVAKAWLSARERTG